MSDNNGITRKPTGFQLAPENINRNGAPKKEESISGLVRELLRNKPTGNEKTYRELFAMRVMKLALEGDMTAIREIWDRMEGSVRGRGDTNLNLALQINQTPLTDEDRAFHSINICNRLLANDKIEYVDGKLRMKDD